MRLDTKGDKIIKSDDIGIENIERGRERHRDTETHRESQSALCKKISRTLLNCATTLYNIAHMYFKFLKNVCSRRLL